MQLYQVIADHGVKFSANTALQLNPDQVAARAHVLIAVDGVEGCYFATQDVFFKRGEVIGLDTVSKAYDGKLVEFQDAAAAKPRKRKNKKDDASVDAPNVDENSETAETETGEPETAAPETAEPETGAAEL